MKIGKLLILLVIGFAFSRETPLFASEEARSQLSSLVAAAIGKNPELISFRAKRDAAKERIIQATALDDPQLVLTLDHIPNNGDIRKTHERSIGIEQIFPYYGKRSLKQKIAELESEIADLEYQEKVWEVTSSVKSAYYQLVFLTKSIALHREHESLLSELISIARKRYVVSQSSQQDLLKSDIEQARLQNKIVSLEREILSANAEIHILMGERSHDEPLKTKPVAFPPFLQTLDTLKEMTLQSPRLKKAQRFFEKNRKMSQLIQKESNPDFMLGLYYQSLDGEEDQWMATGKIPLSVFSRKKYQSKNHVAHLDEEEAIANYDAINDETLFAIHRLFNEIKAIEDQTRNDQNELIPLALQALEVARISYQTGKGDLLNWIDSERTLLDLQMEQAMKQTLFQQKIAKMEQLVGKEISQ